LILGAFAAIAGVALAGSIVFSADGDSPAQADESVEFPGFEGASPALQERLRAAPEGFFGEGEPVSEADLRSHKARVRRELKRLSGPMTTIQPSQWINIQPDYFSTTQFWPVRNGWFVASRRNFTAVYGGGNGMDDGDNTTGRIAVFHQNYVRTTQSIDFVDVPGAGALKLTDAPIGRKRHLDRLQRRAVLSFKGKNGITGKFHLRDHSVTLDG
jgi:hypothetical protein